MHYLPAIDGLRAVAVVLVLLFHAKVPLFSGGYVGVDAFFPCAGAALLIAWSDLQSRVVSCLSHPPWLGPVSYRIHCTSGIGRSRPGQD